MKNSSDWILDDRVQDLLAEWVERNESGEEVSAESLCLDNPELLERLNSAINQLQQSNWIVEPDAESDDLKTYSLHIDAEQVIQKADTVSAEELLQRVELLPLLSEDTVNSLWEILKKDDGQKISRELLELGLTSYQLLMLCEDRGDELLLNDYLLLEPIGEGGMGRVYKAKQLMMDRIVAVKVLNPRAFDSEQGIQRFRREVQIAALLIHPNIVSAYDAGEDAGRHYLVMEYINGCDLSTLVLGEQRLEPNEAVGYILQAAQALEYAHTQGVVHRDVKPSNLLLDTNGMLKVLDLGLARFGSISEGESAILGGELTASGQVMGTIDYLAPEQAVDSRNADERSDIYSLGCTLYSLLHGRPVYDRESVVNRLLAHQSGKVPSLAAGRDDIPVDLNAIFMMMIAKDPNQRYQTMAEVIVDLQAVQKGESIAHTKESLSREFKKRLGLSLTGVVLSLALFAILFQAFRPDGETLVPESDHGLSQQKNQSESGNSFPVQPPLLAMAPFDPRQATAHQEAWALHLGVPVEFTNSIGMTFRLIPPGEFVMGTSKDDLDKKFQFPGIPLWQKNAQSEFPPHRVRITRPYYMAIYEVTQKQYLECGMGKPSYFSPIGLGKADVEAVWTGDFPVESMTWFDAVRFCNTLSHRNQTQGAYEIDGDKVVWKNEDGYRLPTEAEWEFAACSGSDQDYCFGDGSAISNFSWSYENSGNRTHAVGMLKSNAFGLYDVHGNVFEWCWDVFSVYSGEIVADPQGPENGNLRMHRSGSWENWPLVNRSAMRSCSHPKEKNHRLGFRVALSVKAFLAKDSAFSTSAKPE